MVVERNLLVSTLVTNFLGNYMCGCNYAHVSETSVSDCKCTVDILNQTFLAQQRV